MSEVRYKADLAAALGYSVRYFFKMVNHNLEIWQALQDAGYNTRSRTLTPKQIEIICNYYGYPDCINRD